MPANPYCSVAQLGDLYDLRVLGMLSNDNSSKTVLQSRVQLLLDMQASEMESHVDGRWDLGAVRANPPPVLMKWVGASTMGRLYARRNDMPKEVAADVEWSETWIAMLRKGEIKLPGFDRANGPFKIGRPSCGSITDRLPFL